MMRRAAEQAADAQKTARAWHKDMLADRTVRGWTGFADNANRLITGNERVLQAGELRHAPCPEQTFRARADAGPKDLDDHIDVRRGDQPDLVERDAAWLPQNDGQGVLHDT